MVIFIHFKFLPDFIWNFSFLSSLFMKLFCICFIKTYKGKLFWSFVLISTNNFSFLKKFVSKILVILKQLIFIKIIFQVWFWVLTEDVVYNFFYKDLLQDLPWFNLFHQSCYKSKLCKVFFFIITFDQVVLNLIKIIHKIYFDHLC